MYLEASYHLAKNNFNVADIEKSIGTAYEKATLSKIEAQKLNALVELYESSLTEFKKDSTAHELFLHFEEQPSPELSALTVVANAIMNLDEFLTKA